MPDLDVRHLSIRVPWHDTAWDGRVCERPRDNVSCLALPRIHENRDDDREEAQAGRQWDDDSSPVGLPPCARERVSFMAEREIVLPLSHPYQSYSDAHRHLRTTPMRLPPHSAGCVPFRWMRREQAEEIAELEGVRYQVELEETANDLIGFDSGWVQHGHNQRAMLDGFFSRVTEGRSLCFFYARRVPHTEEDGKILLGAGFVDHVGDAVPYECAGANPLDTLAWERAVQHSVRRGFENGFLLPYHDALTAAEEDPDLDPEEVVAFAPADAWDEFAFGTEHVSNDTAIASLAACEAALRRAGAAFGSRHERELRWIGARIGELWKLRGPCPGIASALEAFGVQHAALVVRKLRDPLERESDPWTVVNRAFEDPHSVVPGLQADLGHSLRQKWQMLPDERRALLKLISRFDVSPAQAARYFQPAERAEAGIAATDSELISNPYLLFELDRGQEGPIPVLTVDHGTFPDPELADAHPLPDPSRLLDALDVRRGRALMVAQLESAAARGDTLQTARDVVAGVAKLPLSPPCPLDEDMLMVYGDLTPALERTNLAGGAPAFQLRRLRDVGTVISREVDRRVGGARHEVDVDWASRLYEVLGAPPEGGDGGDEARARSEKAAALAELAASRFAILVGPAGTGKTTLLRALCDAHAIASGGVLLLAPTGKARVRLAQALDRPAQTIAQFLLPLGRYVPTTNEYRLGQGPREAGYRTVIVDEASMLTEEQLAAVIDGLDGVGRLILVGDPRQLPPIGSGRPFVDLEAKLRPDLVDGRFPRVGPSYAELMIPRRVTFVDGRQTNEAQRRHDLMLAEWFSGRPPSPGADEIWDLIRSDDLDETLTVRSWSDHAELRELLLDSLVEELELEGPDDVEGFERSLGGTVYDGHVYFWRAQGDRPGTASAAEAWQLLAPVRGRPHGVRELNRMLQQRFRGGTRERSLVRRYQRRLPKPFGPEGILYGDKVLAVVNDSSRSTYPAGGDGYVANGDIGVVVGQFKTRAMRSAPWKVQVEYASQPGFVYDYDRRDALSETETPIELAYAITVHKAQGSEFERTIVVLPDPCRTLTRELLYTALTRQRRRCTILYQGDPGSLRSYARPAASATALRSTNLFRQPEPVEVATGTFLDAGLIHRTSRGDVVRSKSEVIIAELLNARGVEYAYERRLTAPDGSFRYPDFTIEDAASGRLIFWEHLGMLSDSVYAERWERKQRWYANQGILAWDAPDASPSGMLVCTTDDAGGGIDSAQIVALMDDVLR